MIRYKGSEIIKKVEDKEIKHGATIKSDDGDIFIYSAEDSTFYWEKSVGGERVPIYTFLNHTFELIEDNTIDIDSIEEVKITEVDSELFVTSGNLVNVAKILNKTVRAVKQLNKEIKEVKEK